MLALTSRRMALLLTTAALIAACSRPTEAPVPDPAPDPAGDPVAISEPASPSPRPTSPDPPDEGAEQQRPASDSGVRWEENLGPAEVPQALLAWVGSQQDNLQGPDRGRCHLHRCDGRAEASRRLCHRGASGAAARARQTPGDLPAAGAGPASARCGLHDGGDQPGAVLPGHADAAGRVGGGLLGAALDTTAPPPCLRGAGPLRARAPLLSLKLFWVQLSEAR